MTTAILASTPAQRSGADELGPPDEDMVADLVNEVQTLLSDAARVRGRRRAEPA